MTMTWMQRCARAAGIVLIPLALSARPASAQYFGQNQVQYMTFDFKVIKTEHFDVYFYEHEREAAMQAARMAERWLARLQDVLQDSLRGRQPLILYAAASQFRQTNTVAGIGEGTGGVTESFKRRIVLPFGVSLDETDHVIGHELVHAFQYDIMGRTPSGVQGSAAMPLWFIEGMAEYLSIGPVDAHTAMWIREAIQRNDMPTITDLDNPNYFPYRYGQAFWAYVGGRFGDEAVGDLFRNAIRMRDPHQAIRAALRIDPDSLSAEWHAAIRQAYGPPPDSAQQPLVAPANTAQPIALFTKASTGGSVSVGPSLSPDGNRIMFLSERNRLAIDLYLADAQTGHIIRRVTHAAVDPHLESLQFIYSSGAWSPDSRQFAVATQVNGRPVLRVYAVDEGGDEEYRVSELDEIFNPSWSPDGRQVTFTGQLGGLTDLYVYDTGSRELRRLTNDAYANLEPAWSPDGRTIAYVTDEEGTDLRLLSHGPYRLALLDVASGRVSRLPHFAQGKQINPQWSRDGRMLFFLADPDGITNVYRLDVAAGQIYRLTDLRNGASGIAALSPALSVGGDRMAVSVYRDGGAEIYTLNEVGGGGRPVSDLTGYEAASTLPPHDRVKSLVTAYRDDDRTGLPPADSFPVLPYRATFGLDYVAQTNVGVSTSRFGTFVGGGVALYFSDMMGGRQLSTMVQASGTIKDIALGVNYANLHRRVDWMVSASQIPYVTGGYAQGFDSVGGQLVYVERQIIQRQTNRQLGLAAQYPFNRAQRLEFQISGRQIGFSVEQKDIYYDPVNFVPIGRADVDLPAGEDLFLGEAMTALVYDNSLFGGTGPIMGSRWRLEVSPTVGSLNFIGALADIRKYIPLQRSITLAGRVMHYGRYGPDGADTRLSPLYIGYQSLVRGYDNGSFSPIECRPSATDECPVYNNLLGNRILVGNVELRMQMMGPFGLAVRSFLPIDLAFFADGGTAWYPGESPAMFGGDRPLVGSVGAGLRLNLFGFIIAEMDLVKPLNRPDKGAYFQFGFNPGF